MPEHIDFQAILDAIPDSIYLYDSELRYLYVNPAGAATAGLKSEDLVGKTWQEAGFPAKLMEGFETGIRKVFKTGWPDGGEFQWLLNGDTVYYEHNLMPVRDIDGMVKFVLATARDITERKKKEEDLVLQRTLLQTVFDTTPEHICMLDPEMRYLFVSPSVPKMFDLKLEEMIGRTWHELVLPIGDLGSYERSVRQAFETGTTVKTRSELFIEGEIKYFEDIIIPIRDESGRIRILLTSAREITEWKWFEEALKQTTLLAEKQASELDAAISSLADGIIIYDNNGNITRMNETARKVFGYSTVDYSRAVMDFIIEENAGAQDGGPFKFDEIPVSRALQGEVVRDVEMLINTHTRNPVWIIASMAPITNRSGELLGAVFTFKDITQRKHMEQELRGSEERYRAFAEKLQETDRRKNEFLAMFSHGLRNLLTPIRNSLSIIERTTPGGEQSKRAKSIIDRQIGQLALQVNDLLDITHMNREAIEPRRLSPEGNSVSKEDSPDLDSLALHQEIAHRGRKVLIIDDNIDLAESLRDLLELDGYTVAVAFSGPEGLTKAMEFRPEILLCDIGLPGMDGYEIAEAFCSNEILKNVFLVALTGYAQPEDLQRTTKAGFKRHLAKPVDPNELEYTLAQISVTLLE